MEAIELRVFEPTRKTAVQWFFIDCALFIGYAEIRWVFDAPFSISGGEYLLFFLLAYLLGILLFWLSRRSRIRFHPETGKVDCFSGRLRWARVSVRRLGTIRDVSAKSLFGREMSGIEISFHGFAPTFFPTAKGEETARLMNEAKLRKKMV